MDTDATGWRFAQCFGDKGEVEDITEGASLAWSTPPLRLAAERVDVPRETEP